jgi:molybdopterin molybdotransferase
MQENVRLSGNAAIIDEAPGQARYVRKRASDFAEEEELVPAGRLLDCRAIVAAAAADVADVEAYLRPRVHILSTGDELAEPGSARDRADAIPESVSFGVAALAGQWGGDFFGRTRLRDDHQVSTSDRLVGGLPHRCKLVTGGASVGEKDFAKAMFEPVGLELIFCKVSIKPGKPAWLGRAGGGFILGLPGNPSSAMVTARLFLAPLLAGLTGRPIEDALQWRDARLASLLGACGTRETFHRARLAEGAAEILSFQDSSAQKALANADLLVRQRADSPALEPGAIVEVLDF